MDKNIKIHMHLYKVTYDNDAFFVVKLMGFFQRRPLQAAKGSPGSPEIQHYNFALMSLKKRRKDRSISHSQTWKTRGLHLNQ